MHKSPMIRGCALCFVLLAVLVKCKFVVGVGDGGGGGASSAHSPSSPYAHLSERLSAFDLAVHEYSGVGSGRGILLRTVRDRRPGERLLDWNDDDVVYAERVLERRPDLAAAALYASRTIGRPLTDESILACYAVLEELDDDPNPNPNDEDAFARYRRTLPVRISSGLDDALLPHRRHLPRCYAAAIDCTRDYVTRTHSDCLAALEATTQTQTLSTAAVSAPTTTSSLLPLDRYRRAFAAIRSRSFALDERSFRLEPPRSPDVVQRDEFRRRVLLPVHDSLNHRRGARTRIEQLEEAGGKIWRLFSDDAYSAGDEVCTSYGDDRDNLDMMLNYGFVDSENGHWGVRFDVSDFLDAAAKADPRVFTLENLRGLRTRLENVETARRTAKPLQDLALFSVDIVHGMPHPCEWLRATLHAFDYVSLALGCADEDAQRLPEHILLAILLRRLAEIDEAAASLESDARKRAQTLLSEGRGGDDDDDGAEEDDVWEDQIRTLLSAERRAIETITSRLR